ncbi:hypothetical protein EV1_043483 [Malus domestica]
MVVVKTALLHHIVAILCNISLIGFPILVIFHHMLVAIRNYLYSQVHMSFPILTMVVAKTALHHRMVVLIMVAIQGHYHGYNSNSNQ